MQVCNSIKAVKYLFRYFRKEGDRAIVELQAVNKVKEYLEGCYLGPTETVWRLPSFRLHEEFRLAVHEEGKWAVYYPQTIANEPLQLCRFMEAVRSPLMAFFHYNGHVLPDAQRYMYADMPRWFTWNRRTKFWQPRQRGFTIRQISFRNPQAGELFYLWLLLLHRAGPTGFEDLRKIEGQLYPAYRATCAALGLLEDDREWLSAFEEAIHFSSGSTLQSMAELGLLYVSTSG